MKLTSLSGNETIELITPRQAARILNLAEDTVRNYRLRGYIKSVPTTDNKILFDIKEVEAYKIRRAELQKQRKRESLGLL